MTFSRIRHVGVPGKDRTSALWTLTEMGLKHCPFLGSSERVCARHEATQHSRGLMTRIKARPTFSVKGLIVNFQAFSKAYISPVSPEVK